MRLGLGTGSTVAHLLPALAERGIRDLSCVATSPATELAARALGLHVFELDDLGPLDMAIDGADQIDRDGWLVKGGGGALTREKIVAAAAQRFVVIASAEKAVETLTPPVPLELLTFGAQSTMDALGEVSLRRERERSDDQRGLGSATGQATVVSPDGGLIADYRGPIGAPAELAARLSATPGVVEHGLFAPDMVSLILIGTDTAVERRTGARAES